MKKSLLVKKKSLLVSVLQQQNNGRKNGSSIVHESLNSENGERQAAHREKGWVYGGSGGGNRFRIRPTPDPCPSTRQNLRRMRMPHADGQIRFENGSVLSLITMCWKIKFEKVDMKELEKKVWSLNGHEEDCEKRFCNPPQISVSNNRRSTPDIVNHVNPKDCASQLYFNCDGNRLKGESCKGWTSGWTRGWTKGWKGSERKRSESECWTWEPGGKAGGAELAKTAIAHRMSLGVQMRLESVG